MQNDYVVVAKNHANILVEALKNQGVTLKKAQALEIISDLHSRTDWNRLQSKLKGLNKPGSQTKCSGASTFDAFFIYGFSTKGVPLETLRSLFELECADGETTPVMIAVAGDGHTYNHVVDRYFNNRERLTITYDADGVVDISHNGYLGKGLLINLVSEKRGKRHGAGLALAQFLNNRENKYSLDRRQRIGTLMISDFGQIEESECAEVCEAISGFSKSKISTFRRLIATTHKSNALDFVGDLGMHVKELFYSETAESANPTVAIDTRFMPRTIYASSLEDPSVVNETLTWLRAIALVAYEEYFGSTESRAKRIPGNSLWFKDLRASLLDDSSRM